MTTGLTLNGTALSEVVPEVIITRVVRPLVGARRFRSIEVPGRAGSWRWAEEAGDRSIEFPFHIAADSLAERRDAVRRLAGWADLGGETGLVIDDEPDRYHDAILDNSPNLDEWLLNAAGSLVFAVGPYAHANAPTALQLVASGGSPDSGSFSIDDELTALPIIEVTPTDGAIASLVLTVNEVDIAWSGALGDDDTLTISSVSDTVTLGVNVDVNLTGAFDPAAVNMADVSGVFPILVPGSNTWVLSWTGSATTVTLDVTWRERFR